MLRDFRNIKGARHYAPLLFAINTTESCEVQI